MTSTLARSSRPAPSVSITLLAGHLLSACASPDLGYAPFLCNQGVPACPDGYACATVEGQRICVREGATAPDAKDAGYSDGSLDGPPAPDAAPVSPPRERIVVISEFLADPQAVADEQGEYVELFNMTDAPVDLAGWTIKDNGAESHTITGSLVVLSKRYVVLAVSTDSRTNGGVSAAYALEGFTLGNTMDDILLLDSAGKVMDGMSYAVADGFEIAPGAALSLRNPFAASNDPTNWCLEPSPWAGSAGDSGSPGSGPRCR